MAMTVKDFNMFATILAQTKAKARTHREKTLVVHIARRIGFYCVEQNDRFELHRFLQAADCVAMVDDA